VCHLVCHMSNNIWTDADRISDTVVNAVNAELSAGTQPVHVLAGQLLGLKATLRTAPASGRPLPMVGLGLAIDVVLMSLMEEYGRPE
jgi:hypothetical protein